jgi:hypothetical protein
MIDIGPLAVWFPHDMLTLAAVCIGGLTVAVTLSTYIYDYITLPKNS